MIDLRGKTVLVTGGSRGIGEAIVRSVAVQGAKVVLHYGQSRAPAEAIRDAIGRESCVLVQADLGSSDAATHLWHEATAAVTRIDVLVNNAGIFELCRLAVAHFRKYGGGRIINVTSRAAHRGDAPDHWSYADTEMAHAGLAEPDLKRIISEIPLGAMASPEECGALAAFLCSDKVRHMTGATFDINGASYVR